MKAPTFEGTKATSYSYPYASSLRNSQVLVTRRHFSELTRHAIDGVAELPEAIRYAPFSLVVSPNARHAILSTRMVGWAFSDGSIKQWEPRGDVVALDDELFIRGQTYTWAGAGLDQRNVTLTAAARRIEGEHYAAVGPYQVYSNQGNQPPLVFIEGGRRFPRYLGDGLDWSTTILNNSGTGAIGGDWSVVVALDSGMLQVYLPIADDQKHNLLFAERRIGVKATGLSLIGSNICVVAPDGAGSRLLVFSANATPLYSLSVPFEVMQPAIAGSAGRVYLAGKGLAAIDDGKLSWSHPSHDTVYASTFEDGSLALATANRLDFVNTDGSVDQSFTTDEPLVVPPAIAGDGSVWVASILALYVAR